MISDLRKKLNRQKSRKVYEQLITDVRYAKLLDSIPKYDFSISPTSEFIEFDHNSINAALDFVCSFTLESKISSDKFYVSFSSTEISENYWIEINDFTRSFIEKATNYLTSLEYIIIDSRFKPILLFLEEEYTYRVYIKNLPKILNIKEQ